MKKLIFIICVFSLNVYAENRGVQVYVTDEFIDSSSLEKKYEVTRVPDKDETLPDLETRDGFLREVDAANHWDDLKKDIFYMDLKFKTLKALVAKYPEIREEELKALKGKRK